MTRDEKIIIYLDKLLGKIDVAYQVASITRNEKLKQESEENIKNALQEYNDWAQDYFYIGETTND